MSLRDHAFIKEHLTGWKRGGAFYLPDDKIPWMAGGAGAFFPISGPDNIVRLFLTGRDKSIRTRIGVVTLRWNDCPAVLDVTHDPVFDLGQLGHFDMDGVSYPWIVENGGSLYMYYVGWNRLGGEIPFRNQIGLAVSHDNGKSFQRTTKAPLLPLTDAEPIGSGSCCVERVAGGWRLFYTNFLRWERAANGARHFYHVRQAYSKDGIEWERPGTIVIDLIPPDEYALGAPDLSAYGREKVLYFTARGHRYRLFASVEDGNGRWLRLPGHLEIPRSDFDSDMQCYPRSLIHNGRSYLLYSGNGYGRAGIGYAEWMGR